MKLIVNYMPENLSEDTMQIIRDTVTPSLVWDDCSQYNCDAILEQHWHIQSIVEACDGCDYLEI